MCATSGVIVAALAVAIGGGIASIIAGNVFRPDPAGVGGEFAGDGLYFVR